MFKVSVMYPNEEEAEFDYEYYKSTHMKLVEEHLKPFGVIKTEVDKPEMVMTKVSQRREQSFEGIYRISRMSHPFGKSARCLIKRKNMQPNIKIPKCRCMNQ
ncbi:MAG: hypothetical protein JRI52_04110 [Deltaproteobacteria bacterium]|nr:hypothetical protein [Deltaproteobacteria bacterium]